MSGIYIHIPYCRQACNYCDFHFTASLKHKEDMVMSLCKEIELRKDYLSDSKPETLYFGGGTPSLLSIHEFEIILNCLKNFYDLSEIKEFTFEANPDDLNLEYLQSLHALGVNRLSIGIQSFHDDDLKFLNRRHSSQHAKRSVLLSKQAGISNITVDLIYGIPGLTDAKWQENLDALLALNVNHFSAYHLGIEERTVFGYYQRKGSIKAVSEEQSIKQYNLLLDFVKVNDYVQYEISNFARSNAFAVHNVNYWKNHSYIGIGPSAHSFNGDSRQWNVSLNQKYIDSIKQNQVPTEIEVLDLKMRLNEYILTGLRTMWGIDMDFVTKEFGTENAESICQKVEQFICTGKAEMDKSHIVLTPKGFFISDYIIEALMC